MAVPDVTGLDAATATATLEQAGFTVEVVDTETSDPAEVGIVVGQDPAPGADAAVGDVVTIVVGSEAAP